MEIRIISLKSSSERRQHMSKHMKNMRIDFKWFDALNGTQGQSLATQLNLNNKIDDTRLSQGEIGCMMSHISLWKEMVDKKIQWMCIMEDDIHFGENAHTFLSESDWIPKHCDCVKLEKMDNKITVYRSTTYKFENRHLLRLAGCHLGAAAYILSLQGAMSLINHIKRSNTIDAIDHVLFEDITNTKKFVTYQMSPALCMQDTVLNKTNTNLKSNLEPDRKEKRKRPPLSIKQKIKRETTRIIQQITTLVSNLIHGGKTIYLDYK